jgi:hypothetical protein
MRLNLLFILPAILFLHSSCKKYSPAEEAFFIKPGQISVSTTSSQGSGSHKITDLWLYVNGQFQGAYPVENTMPIVSKGASAKINIYAGIKRNGISDTRIFSNFYQLLEIDTFVTSGKTITRPFTFKYSPAVTFTWTENFDGQGYSVQKSAGFSDTTFRIADPSDSFEGKSLELGLSANSPTGSVAQIESGGSGFALPFNSSDVFLELNYKCNTNFVVGLIGEDNSLKSALTVNAHDEWNKIYIQLAEAIGTAPVSSKYKVFFSFIKLQEGSPRIFLDNIKLVFIK